MLYHRYVVFDIEADTSSDPILRKSFDEEKGESSSLEIHMPNHPEYDVLKKIDSRL